MRMVQARERLCFLDEAVARAGKRPAVRLEHLDRDVPFQVGVAGAIDLSHATAAERVEDFVRTDTESC
jgi:hypothetical protein